MYFSYSIEMVRLELEKWFLMNAHAMFPFILFGRLGIAFLFIVFCVPDFVSIQPTNFTLPIILIENLFTSPFFRPAQKA